MKHIIGLLVLSLALPAQALKTLTFQKDILPREARAWEYDKAMSLNTNGEVSFKVDGAPTVSGGALKLNGTITNSSSVKKTIYIVGDKDSFKLEVATNGQIKLRDAKKANPAMFALEIPAKTEVKIVGSTALDEYIYEGSPETKLKWTFQFWNSPRPTGELTFKLPAASEAKLPPFKIEFQKFTAPDQAKFTAYLKNVSKEAQIFCRSSQVDFYWNLKTVDGGEIANPERLDVEYANRPMTAGDCSVINPNETHELETANIKKDGEKFLFETQHITWKNLKPGQYQVWFQALNSAVGDDQKVIEAIRAKKAAAKPSKAIETTETTQSVSIP